MRMSVTTRGLRSLTRDLKQFPIDLRKNTLRGTKKLATSLKKSATMLTPVGVTHNLRTAIQQAVVTGVEKRNVIEVRINFSKLSSIRYFKFQEYGFAPHWVSAIRHPEVAQWAKYKGVPLTGGRSLFVKKAKKPEGYIIGEAFRRTSRRLPKILDQATDGAIRKFERGR